MAGTNVWQTATVGLPNKPTTAKANNNGTYSYKLNGKTYTVKPASDGGYMQAYQQYVADAEAGKNLYDQQFSTNASNLKSTLTQNNATTNANYDNSARQAYVDYMRNRKALPSQLQALGVRGGATESGLLNLYNNYGVEHAANEQQRNADLTSNQQAYDDAYAKLVADRTQYLMDYEKDLAAQKQTAINNQMNEYNNEITRFSSSIAQYPTTESGYKSYQNWLKKVESSNDPLKDIKAALIRQQMATQFPDGAPESSGSGGSGGGGGGGYRRGGYSRRGSSSNSGRGGYSRRGSSSNSGSAETDRTASTVSDAFATTAAALQNLRPSSRGTTTKKKTSSKSYTGGRYYTTRRNVRRGGIW